MRTEKRRAKQVRPKRLASKCEVVGGRTGRLGSKNKRQWRSEREKQVAHNHQQAEQRAEGREQSESHCGIKSGSQGESRVCQCGRWAGYSLARSYLLGASKLGAGSWYLSAWPNGAADSTPLSRWMMYCVRFPSQHLSSKLMKISL